MPDVNQIQREERLKRILHGAAEGVAEAVVEAYEEELGRTLTEEEWENASASIAQGIEDSWIDLPRA